MPRFKKEDITNIVNPREKRAFINDFIKNCDDDDPIQISDLLANKNSWGGMCLQTLGIAEEQLRMRGGDNPMMWNLQVISDEWGNKLTEGDIVIRRVKSNYKDVEGQSIDPSEISSSRLDGSYEERFVMTKKFKVDKKGCIRANFEDAVSMCNLWGLHSVTGRTLTTKKATSREPQECPNGQKLHCHYWRYKEVTKEQYDKLPNIKKRTYLLRGIDDLELINVEDDDKQIVKEVRNEKHKQQIIEEAKK
jgi:hypothetical protein